MSALSDAVWRAARAAPGAVRATWVLRDTTRLAAGFVVAGISLLSLCASAYLDAWVYAGAQSFHIGVSRLSGSTSGSSPSGVASGLVTGEPMGWIVVPRLGLSAVIAHGDDASTLRSAVGHIPGTPVPGREGNVGLAGHRDSVFRGLERVRANDEVVLIMRDGEFSYRVVGTEIVEPSRVDVLEPTDVPSLTLVTCYPFDYIGPAPHRFIVRAESFSIRASATPRIEPR